MSQNLCAQGYPSPDLVAGVRGGMSNLALADEKENHHGESVSMPGPPPAGGPPAPPPPPPPPPPLPGPGSGGAQGVVRKRRRVRSFFWKTIPEEKVRGKPNIWTMAVRQQQYQIDVRTVEELFGQQEETRQGVASSRSCSSLKESKEEISILDPKRGMNMGIFLKQFKKSNQSIIDDIRHGNSKRYGPEALRELLKLLPEAEEVKKLQAFKGDTSKLTLVDSFMYLLIQVPSFDVRIEAMVLKEEFFPSCPVMSREIDVIRTATKELMTCEELHAILHLVLQAGNIMNAGGYAGNAVGFKLSSLLSLADTKANKPGMNLLHFVALEAQKKDEGLLKFPEKLQHVQSAARISVENIETELQSLYFRIRSIEEKIQRDEELLRQLEDFLQNSTRTLQELTRRRLDLRKEGNTLIDFFCEDKDTFKLDDCFRIFQDFCLKFKKAVKDNHDRKLKEVARQQRLRELEEKRFLLSSWERGGGFGRSSSENDVDTLSKEGLLDFLQPRSQSPRSPLGRSSSVRRCRHTMAAAADRELHSYLELFSAGEVPHFNSLPRPSRPHQRRTIPWLAEQDSTCKSVSTGQPSPGMQATSPGSDRDPLNSLAGFSTGFDIVEDRFLDNKTVPSEGQVVPRTDHNKNHLCRSSSVGTGQLNVNIEKRTLVPGPPPLVLGSPNNNNMHLADQGDLVITDLERELDPPKNLVLDTPPSSKDSETEPDSRIEWDCKMDSPQFTLSPLRDEEDSSMISSTTCDTPLPLDLSLSSKKPVFYILDCTETDCSVILDYSETDSSSVTRDGVSFDSKMLNSDSQANLKEQSSHSSNIESTSSNDQSLLMSPNEPEASESNDSVPKGEIEGAEMDSCRNVEGIELDKQTALTNGSKSMQVKTKPISKTLGVHNTREVQEAHTSNTPEHQALHKVVPITKTNRVSSTARKVEKLPAVERADIRRQHRDHSMPARRNEKLNRTPRNSSMPPEDPKGHRGIPRWARDSPMYKASIRKPSAKPLRNIPKPPPEEKMCRSTMRALAQAQAASEGNIPNTPTHGGQKTPGSLPSFARNTVASSSRRAMKDLGLDSNPSTPSKSATLTRTGSQRQASTKAAQPSAQHSPREESKPQGTLRRVQSAKGSSRSGRVGDRPTPLKSSSFSEKSRDSISSKSLKPSWK